MRKLSSILLVDDDNITNYLNQRLLAQLDVAEQIVVAEDGRQALDWVVEHC